ncbi:hypothetical protein K8M07_07680 [Schnuerera sp. xch1]|nr:hypothetical protein [Schnuerera sp. xch1]MBZ2175134.1 hypothetical protein [Schnuerera sp. xch1]
MLNEDARTQLKGIFEGMDKDVTIVLFTKKEACLHVRKHNHILRKYIP